MGWRFALKKIVFIPILLVSAAFFVPYVFSADIDELRQTIEQKNVEIRKLEEEAKKYRDEIASKQQVGKTLKEELARIERTVAQLRRDITLTERKIKKAELEIETVALEIREKEIAVKKLRSGLGGLIQTLSKQEQESVVEILIKNSVLSAFFQQLEYTSALKKKLLSSLDALRALQKELAIKKAEAEEKKDELEDLEGLLKDRRGIQENIRRERSEILATTKNQEKRYQELLRETEKKQEAILREIEELEEDLRKRVDPESLPTRREGFLKWPAEGLLSQGYGETPFTKSSRGRHFYKFHNGIDISASVGTPILAADDGTITATGDTDRYCRRGAYGKYIVVDHKNNLATMYAHLSLIKVSSGQEVKKGDIIGYMGNSGLSTGPHLHFTLYDARTVEIRLGNIGTCGLLPFGGSLNPLLYL